MEELNNFQLFTYRILYLVGWLIGKIRNFFSIDGTMETATKSFYSPLLWLTFGLFFAFASLHIFKRILRKD